MLSNLVEGDVLFIDEIHRIARPAEEMLYLAMEDFRVDVVVGKGGPGATSIPLEVAPFTLVGATTRSGALTGPLRDRFGFTAHMDFYEPEELQQILMRSAGILASISKSMPVPKSHDARGGTPRIANRLLRRVRDFAEVRADGIVTMDVAQALGRLRRGPVGLGPSRPFGTECFGAFVRRRARRRVDACGGRRRGTVDGGRSVRAVPGPGRNDRPDAARTCGYRRCLDSTRNDTAAGCRSGRYRVRVNEPQATLFDPNGE